MKGTIGWLLVLIGVCSVLGVFYFGYLFLFEDLETQFIQQWICDDAEIVRREERDSFGNRVSVHYFCESESLSRDVTTASALLTVGLLGSSIMLTFIPTFSGGFLLVQHTRETIAEDAEA